MHFFSKVVLFVVSSVFYNVICIKGNFLFFTITFVFTVLPYYQYTFQN